MKIYKWMFYCTYEGHESLDPDEAIGRSGNQPNAVTKRVFSGTGGGSSKSAKWKPFKMVSRAVKSLMDL